MRRYFIKETSVILRALDLPDDSPLEEEEIEHLYEEGKISGPIEEEYEEVLVTPRSVVD